MLVASYVNVKPDVAHSRTYEDFYKFLGANPKYMGVMARMNQTNTALLLTEGLMNVFYNSKKVNQFQPINSLLVEWNIDVNWVRRVEFAASPDGDGARGSEIRMYFKEKYYDRYDTFIIEESHQQCIVLALPQNKGDNFWEYIVKLVDSDFEAVLDASACVTGMTTRFLSNIMPEYHSEGYLKYTSNFETHRTWITEHRVDGSMSSRYEAMEDQFIKIAEGKNDKECKERLFKLSPLQKDTLEQFKEVKNNALLWQKTTMNTDGKSTIYTEDGRPLIAGDGLIPQYERFANKAVYSVFNVQIMYTIMKQMSERSKEPTGNHWLFLTNEPLWHQIQTGLGEWFKSWKPVADTSVYSKAAGKYLKIDNPLKVGATWVSYEIAGNTVSFVVDRALTKQYRTKGYGICLDLTPDMESGNPAIAAFTLPGKEFVVNYLQGVGIENGAVATPVAGKKFIVSGYSGIAAFAPYRSFILRQN